MGATVGWAVCVAITAVGRRHVTAREVEVHLPCPGDLWQRECGVYAVESGASRWHFWVSSSSLYREEAKDEAESHHTR
jgi:hypothetical protein